MQFKYSFATESEEMWKKYQINDLVLFLGSTFGLRLTINIEEYEYMPGPNSDAGIKVSI